MKKNNWFLKHKIISIIIVFIVLITVSSIGNKDSRKSFQEGMDAGKKQISDQNKDESFKEKDALNKIQGYELKENITSLDEPTVGMYLSVYLEKLVLKEMKINPASTKTGNWSVENNNNGTYTVSYKFSSLGLDKIFTWEVGKDSIKAINGKAITITPEFGE